MLALYFWAPLHVLFTAFIYILDMWNIILVLRLNRKKRYPRRNVPPHSFCAIFISPFFLPSFYLSLVGIQSRFLLYSFCISCCINWAEARTFPCLCFLSDGYILQILLCVLLFPLSSVSWKLLLSSSWRSSSFFFFFSF